MIIPEKGANAPLGKYTKSLSQKSGTNRPVAPEKPEVLRKKFVAQEVVQKLLREHHGLHDPDLERTEYINRLNQAHRVCKCNYTPVDTTVAFNMVAGNFHFSNLSRCGSVWACPVCAHKITTERRFEVKAASNWALDNGYRVMFVTHTIPHYADQTCAQVRKSVMGALNRFHNRKDIRKLRTSGQLVGHIRSVENLHGYNGWHFHTHTLYFFKSACTKTITRDFRRHWEDVCKKMDLIPKGKLNAFRKHGIDIKFDAQENEYGVKFGDPSGWVFELTSPDTKWATRSKSKPLSHPFSLLSQNSNKAHAAFLEYVRDMKGQRFITWSNGLKELVGLDDVTDTDLLEYPDPDRTDRVDLFTWREIRTRVGRHKAAQAFIDNTLHALLDKYDLMTNGQEIYRFTNNAPYLGDTFR